MFKLRKIHGEKKYFTQQQEQLPVYVQARKKVINGAI